MYVFISFLENDKSGRITLSLSECIPLNPETPVPWDKWNKIIGHSFIELMKIPVETQKELYSIYKDSMEVKLTNAIKRLKKVKKQSEKHGDAYFS